MDNQSLKLVCMALTQGDYLYQYYDQSTSVPGQTSVPKSRIPGRARKRASQIEAV